jgi:plastocyanin
MTAKRWVVWGLLVILIMVGTGCSAGEPAKLVAEMDDMGFSLAQEWSAHAGDPVTITLINNGSLKHEIAILDAGYTLDDGPDVYTEHIFWQGGAEAGLSTSYTLTAPDAPGSYQVVCCIMNHPATGEARTLTVTN